MSSQRLTHLLYGFPVCRSRGSTAKKAKLGPDLIGIRPDWTLAVDTGDRKVSGSKKPTKSKSVKASAQTCKSLAESKVNMGVHRGISDNDGREGDGNNQRAVRYYSGGLAEKENKASAITSWGCNCPEPVIFHRSHPVPPWSKLSRRPRCRCLSKERRS